LAADGRDTTEHRIRVRAYRDLRRDLLRVEPRTILDLRDRGDINDETPRRIQRDLELEETRSGTEF